MFTLADEILSRRMRVGEGVESHIELGVPVLTQQLFVWLQLDTIST